jgi:phenylacetate-CoA ligase
MPAVKTAEELRGLQLEGLKWTVNHAYQGSSFYRNRMDKEGIRPEDIQSLDDMKRLPFTGCSHSCLIRHDGQEEGALLHTEGH